MTPILPGERRRRTPPPGDAPLVIGLVNNMPDAALRSTERQYRELLAAASPQMPVRLLLFSLPEVPRGEAARAEIDARYEDFATLWETRLDGMIVTGMPPRAAQLQDEPYWHSLTCLADWAEERTFSTVWSCLAAHAAVLHLDGIQRRLLPAKLSGLYECLKAADHAIVAGAPRRWRVPHSRYNELPEERLVARGYHILSTSATAGADMFVKPGRSLFLFLQGHPEYDEKALLREYRRDIAAYLAGASSDYPPMPGGYFEDAATVAFADFAARAMRRRDPDLLAGFPEAAARVAHRWHGLAVRLYENWLDHLAEQRALRYPIAPLRAAADGAAARPSLREDA